MGSLMPLAVIAAATLAAVIAEVAMWFFVYRTTAFKNMKATLETHTQKLEAAKEVAAKNVKKKGARLQGWQLEAGKLNGIIQFKSALVTGVMLVLGYKLVPVLFGDTSVAKLPLNPPGFIRSIAHRGLTDPEPNDCSPMFLFMLCQGSVKIIVGKALGWGPSRTMQEAAVTLPKSFGKQA